MWCDGCAVQRCSVVYVFSDFVNDYHLLDGRSAPLSLAVLLCESERRSSRVAFQESVVEITLMSFFLGARIFFFFLNLAPKIPDIP